METGQGGLLPQEWEIPQQLRDRMGEQVGRQRAMVADGHLLVILHDPPGPEEVDRCGRFFWRQPDGTWHASQGSGPEALANYLEEYEQLLEGLEEQEKGAETAREYFEVLRDLAPLLRAARNMHLALQQARELVPRSKGLINLRALYLNNTQVTDAGLKHLAAVRSLRQIFLYPTKVTDAGVAELKAALPGVQVRY